MQTARLLDVQEVEALMEPTGTYGDPLRALLLAHGAQVFMLSPQRVHDAAEVFDGVPSMHDAKACVIIARLHHQGVSKPYIEPSPLRVRMRALMAPQAQRMLDCAQRSVGVVLEDETRRLIQLTATEALQMGTALDDIDERIEQLSQQREAKHDSKGNRTMTFRTIRSNNLTMTDNMNGVWPYWSIPRPKSRLPRSVTFA
jgi:transposase